MKVTIPQRISDGATNILSGSFADEFPIRAVGYNGVVPMFFTADSGIGTLIEISPINGASLSEEGRAAVLRSLEADFSRSTRDETTLVTLSFHVVSGPEVASDSGAVAGMRAGNMLWLKNKEKFPLASVGYEFLKNLALNLSIQSRRYYVGINLTPTAEKRATEIPLLKRIKSTFSREVEYEASSEILAELNSEFNERVGCVVEALKRAGLSPVLPATPEELLAKAREAWRPSFRELEAATSELIRPELYRGAAEFISRSLFARLYDSFFVADGCLNIVLSLRENPDPLRDFLSSDADGFLRLGEDRTLSKIPFLGCLSVIFAPVPQEEANELFNDAIRLSRAQAGDRGTMREDKAASVRADQLEADHMNFFRQSQAMVRAALLYRLSIPLEYLPKFFDISRPPFDFKNSLEQTARAALETVGGLWEVEKGSYISPWLNSIPGAAAVRKRGFRLPEVNMPYQGALHFAPLFTTKSPDWNSFRGNNFFVSDDKTVFPFDLFSKDHGEAPNVGICGTTGSGKSVVAQKIITMLDNIATDKKPVVIIQDFGGGDGAGSWTKLCQVLGGVEMRFGASDPPVLNVFQLYPGEGLPNGKKIKEVAAYLGLPDTRASRIRILNLYQEVQKLDRHSATTGMESLAERYPEVSGKSIEDLLEAIDLRSGRVLPGEKSMAAIRLWLSLLLARDVNDTEGIVGSPWEEFSEEDIMEAVTETYERYTPPPKERADGPDQWPTLEDFRDTITAMHEERLVAGQVGFMQYDKLIRKLSAWCLDPSLNGQTTASFFDEEKDELGIRRRVPKTCILADFAGISDKRKLALYMIAVNERCSEILYNLQGRRAVCVRDEAWLFTRSNFARKYVEADARLARKYGFAMMTIMQQYTDFAIDAIKNNTHMWLLCSLGGLSLETAARDFGFSAHEYDMFAKSGYIGKVNEVDPVTGARKSSFSRFMLLTNAQKNKLRYVLRNVLDKRELWIFTTEPSEVYVYNYYRRKFKWKTPSEIMGGISWLSSSEYRSDADLCKEMASKGLRVP